MNSEEYLLDIVESYDDLSPKRKQSVFIEAQRRSEELGLEDFERQYELVAEIVERNRSLHHRSLDAAINQDSDFNLYQKIGRQDENLQKLLGMGIEKSNRVQAKKIIAVLSEHLSDDETHVLRQILHRSKQVLTLDVSTKAVVRNIDDIRGKLRAFMHQHCEDGILCIPPDTTIFYIQLSPFRVRLGNALGHPSYLSSEQRKRIITAHTKYRGNASEAERHLPHTIKTILKVWREESLTIGQLALSQAEKERVAKAFDVYQGNATRAAKPLHHNVGTVLNVWREFGLEIKPPGRNLSRSQIEIILAAFHTYNGNAAEAARHLPHNQQTFAKYWKKAKLSEQGNGCTVLLDEQKKIIAAYAECKGKISVAAKKMHYTAATVKKYWKRAGLPTIAGKKPLTQKQQRQIFKAYRRYEGNASEAARNLQFCSIKTITRYWKKTGLT